MRANAKDHQHTTNQVKPTLWISRRKNLEATPDLLSIVVELIATFVEQVDFRIDCCRADFEKLL
jgi:hypothetical protein